MLISSSGDGAWKYRNCQHPIPHLFNIPTYQLSCYLSGSCQRVDPKPKEGLAPCCAVSHVLQGA